MGAFFVFRYFYVYLCKLKHDTMSKRYTEGIAFDGAAILDEGQPITITEILDRLNVKEEEFADKIDEWHKSDNALSLREYLGLTKEQYVLWVEKGEPITTGKILDRLNLLENLIVKKKQYVLITEGKWYFKSKNRAGVIACQDKDEAVVFESKDAAINYNYSILNGDYEAEEVEI